MGVRTSPGFTIIETVLFLAITGLLILGMIGGTSASLNIQRYRDAVESFKSLVQGQYADLSSVQNQRAASWTCDSAVQPIEVSGGGTMPGQTKCLLVGKYMRIEDSDVTTYGVLAYEKAAGTYNDIDSIKYNYTLKADEQNAENSELDWGTHIAWPVSGIEAHNPQSPRSLSILFIRSPDSGLVYTFTSDQVPNKADGVPTGWLANNMLKSGAVIPGQKERVVCIASDGLFVSGDMALYIGPYAASANAIETRSNTVMQSMGVTSRC